MPKNETKDKHIIIGMCATIIYIIFSIIYMIITLLGLIELKSPNDPISNPYFTIMELLIIIIAPLLVLIMVTILKYASENYKIFAIIALIFMSIMATITSSVHFVILTVKSHFDAINPVNSQIFFSFTWPSIVYALDILAWDVFFALSMIFAAFVFNNDRIEKIIKYFMLASGVLALLGIIGVPIANMTVRNIGIIGYAIISPIAISILTILYVRIYRETKKTSLKYF